MSVEVWAITWQTQLVICVPLHAQSGQRIRFPYYEAFKILASQWPQAKAGNKWADAGLVFACCRSIWLINILSCCCLYDDTVCQSHKKPTDAQPWRY